MVLWVPMLEDDDLSAAALQAGSWRQASCPDVQCLALRAHGQIEVPIVPLHLRTGVCDPGTIVIVIC